MPTPTESARGRDWADLTARGRVVYQTAFTYKGMGGTAGGRKRWTRRLWPSARFHARPMIFTMGNCRVSLTMKLACPPSLLALMLLGRSEERRVGKECRS